MKSDLGRANSSIVGVLILALIAAGYVGLYLWWESTNGVFGQPLSSVSMGDAILGVCSRIMIIALALWGLSLLRTIWRGIK